MERDAHEAMVQQITRKTSLGQCKNVEIRKIIVHLNCTRVGFSPSVKDYLDPCQTPWMYQV